MTFSSRSHLSLCLLFVLPVALCASPETDRASETSLRTSFNYRTLLENRVSVTISDGVASLTGVVTDGEHVRLAADTARAMPTIRSIENRIGVDESHAGLSDAAIAVKVRTLLYSQSSVPLASVQLSVEGSVVTLRGTVASHAQRVALGRAVTMVEWVRDVRNELAVDAFSSAVTAPVEQIDDSSITALVLFVLRGNRATSGVQPVVSTRDGVVFLDGGSATSTERAYVLQLTAGIRGVRSVVNRLRPI